MGWAVLLTLVGWATLLLWWLLEGGKPNFFCGDDGTNGESCAEFIQFGGECVVRGKSGVEGSDCLEDEISKVSEGEDCFHLAFSEEEGDTDAFNEEL
jgi:hypothetical protein